MASPRRVLRARKILIASIGVATVSYACSESDDSGDPGPDASVTVDGSSDTGGATAAGGGTATGGAKDAGGGVTSGNLVPPPSGGAKGSGGKLNTGGLLAGNLMAPAPPPSRAERK